MHRLRTEAPTFFFLLSDDTLRIPEACGIVSSIAGSTGEVAEAVTALDIDGCEVQNAACCVILNTTRIHPRHR